MQGDEDVGKVAAAVPVIICIFVPVLLVLMSVCLSVCLSVGLCLTVALLSNDNDSDVHSTLATINSGIDKYKTVVE